MCHLSTKDQYICQSNQGIAEAVTCLLGGAQFSSCPFYHPSSSRCRFRRTRKAADCAGDFSDSNGISDYFKRQKRSHSTEPVPAVEKHLQASRVPSTIVAPVSFMENVLQPWSLPSLRQGKLAMALPASRSLQQIAAADIGAFVAAVIERGDTVFGRRFDIAGDELTGEEPFSAAITPLEMT